jgi:hypothetical protein
MSDLSEAVVAIMRIAKRQLPPSGRLIAQIQRLLDVNWLSVVTREVVEAAREPLVIGVGVTGYPGAAKPSRASDRPGQLQPRVPCRLPLRPPGRRWSRSLLSSFLR